MKISILLPYKENYTDNYAGAVSLFINDTAKLSNLKKILEYLEAQLSNHYYQKTTQI